MLVIFRKTTNRQLPAEKYRRSQRLIRSEMRDPEPSSSSWTPTSEKEEGFTFLLLAMTNHPNRIIMKGTLPLELPFPKHVPRSIEVWRCLACGNETYTGMELCDDCRCIAFIMEWIHYRKEGTKIEPERRGFYQQSILFP